MDSKLKLLETYLEKEDFEKANSLIEQLDDVLDISNISHETATSEFFHYMELKRDYLVRKGEYEQVISICNRICKWAEGEKKYDIHDTWKLDYIYAKIELGKNKDCLELIQSYQDTIADKLDQSDYKILFNKSENYKAQLLTDLGEYAEAKEIMPPLIQDPIMEDFPKILFSFYNTYAKVHYFEGQVSKALEIMEVGFSILKKEGSLRRMAIASSNLGLLYYSQGEFSKAFQHYENALAISENIGNEMHIATVKGNMGKYFEQIGDLNTALQYHLMALEIKEKIGKKRSIANNLEDIADIYLQLNMYELARTNFLRSYELKKEIGVPSQIITSLYKLIKLAYAINDPEMIEKYYTIMQELPADKEDKRSLQQRQVARAMVMKQSGRRRKIGEAETMLIQIIESEVVDIEVFVMAAKLLSNILLEELDASLDEEILDELIFILEKMKSIAEIQHSDLLWVDILLIQSRIHLLTQDGNIIDVLKLLDEAEKIASKSALVGYLEKIQEQREILGKNKHLWDGLHQLSSPDRLHIAKTSNYLGSIQEQMSDASLSISEETPQLLIILNSGGLIRYSHSFEEFESDRVELIGSFITALNSFSMDVFASKLPLQKIQHYDYTIVFVQEKTLLFAYIYKGDSPYAGLRLANFVNYVLADPSLKELSDNRLVVKELDKETKERLRFLFSGK